MHDSPPRLGMLFLTLTVTLLPGPAPAQSSAQLVREAREKLASAVRSGDTNAFLEALDRVLERQDRRAVRDAVGDYARLAEKLRKGGRREDLYFVHNKAARAFQSVRGKAALEEIHRQRTRGREPLGRLLLLDAAVFHDGLDLEQCSLEALRDRSPLVVRRALRYLARDGKRSVVEAVVERFVALEAEHGRSQKGSKKAAGEWIRTLLAFRSALQRLLRVDLPAAIDWKNYVDSRQDDDLFRSPEERQHGRTALTLFGAEVSGKNIVFVVDVSGSMRTTDPEPPGGRKGPRGKTVVGDPAERDPESAAKAAERRRRITRAKKELGRVIRSLPEDVRFNVVAFSSDVTSWKPALVPASRGNKKRATSFVGGLEAEGITVTDMALEEAFGDLELDTVYLITDGAPTHVGSTGRGLPEDARELMELILERMKVLNFLRDVRIFSLGFQGAEEDFLKKLSREHGGRYVRID